jgi:hypothetical protein
VSKLVRNGRLHPILVSHMDTVPMWVNPLNPVRATNQQRRVQIAPGASLRHRPLLARSGPWQMPTSPKCQIQTSAVDMLEAKSVEGAARG